MGTYAIASSAELMENYIQTDILLPQDKFTALQTDAGASLLFSIGTGDIFNLTLEVPGITHGWRLVSLSNAQVKADFPQGATCKTFAAAQAAGQPATVHLAMVLNDGTNDHLYLSLANSVTDLEWVDKPIWVACPFNAVDYAGMTIAPPAPFHIAEVFLGEATDGEYIVVDIIKNPAEPVGKLTRFYLDATKPNAPVWMPHMLAADIQAVGSASTLGRTTQARGIDGMYTKGIIGPSAQLIYTPLYNAFDPSLPPTSARLYLPGHLQADALASPRNPDNTTDLYVAATGGLYYFASTNQDDEAVAILLVTNTCLSGVRDLFAYAADDTLTVWGLNGNDEVFYLDCPLAQVGTATAWSQPRVIMSGVDAISPYVDRAYSANTFFAHGANGLIKAVKTPATKLWNQRPITLPPSATTQAAIPISSYTTHLTVTDENGQPAVGVPVSLTATSVTSVYINHLYYLIGSEPISVLTDQLGTITIVELAHTLAGTRFTATVNQQPGLAINPLDTALQRNATYNTVTSLQSAVITNRDGTTRPFVPAGTASSDLAKVATANQNLSKAYAAVSQLPHPLSRTTGRVLQATPASSLAAAGFANSIETDVGDLISWLGSGIEAAVEFVEDAATGFWNLVATIAGQVYHGILDCAEAVAAAAVWVYDAIKVVVEDILKFLEFLFGWQDILTTHRVLKNVFTQLAQNSIDCLAASKSSLAGLFSQLQTELNKFADIPGFDQTPAGTAASNAPLSGQNSAPANLGVHHFQGHYGASSTKYDPPSPAESLFQDLIDLLAAEQTVMTDAIQAIRTQIIDQFSNLSISEIIKRFIAITAHTVLTSAENIILTLLDVLSQLVAGMLNALKATLDIPVLSWLYKELTGDDLSFLDLACLVAAIPVTLIYKATTNATPFPSNDAFAEGLIEATSFSDIQAQFVLPSSNNEQASRVISLAAAQNTAAESTLDQAKLKTFGIVTGIAALAGSTLLVVASAAQKVLDTLSIPILKKKLATFVCVSNILYVSPNIATLINARTDNWYSQLNNVLTGISILKGIAAIPLAANENKAINLMFPAVESFINAVWNVPVIANIAVNGGDCTSTYKSLIPESIGNFAFNIGGMLELIIARTEPPTNIELAAGQAVLMLTYGVMMVIAGGIYEWAPNQHH